MSQKTEQIDAYLDKLDPERRAALARVRALILEAAPGVVETMKYNMPTFQNGEQVLCAFASQKNYMSLYMDTELVEKHKADLGDLDVGKSCIRFKKLEQLPLDTIRSILDETLQSQGQTA